MKKALQVIKKQWAVFLAGFVASALIVLGIRFFTYNPHRVHYHANFSVFINGQREQFNSFKYYEETGAVACADEPVDSPLERAHMHGNVNDVIHVHDNLVTWSDFFQNLGWGLGNDYIKTADKVYENNGNQKITFILNGHQRDSIANETIGDQDRLLINYGDQSPDQLNQEFNTIASTASKYDTNKDPASCSGQSKVKFTDRLKHLF